MSAGRRGRWTGRGGTVALGIACVLGVVGLLPSTAQASEDSKESDADERHCVVVIDGTAGSRAAQPEERCFKSIADAAAFTPGGETAFGSTTIGWHFTGQSFTGSSIRIVGTTCSGGVWYATGTWNNNIESSYHYCGSSPTRFWDYASCAGSSRSIYASATTLFEMNDRASCVQYG